ncbi:MAG TPA: M1 family metallopeptidase [Gemmatimonadales bacterium]|jgi:aminopeptidase N
MLPLLLALQGPLAATADTIHPRHDAVHHDVILVLGDTGTHILGQVQTTWVLGSSDPVEVPLDSTFRVIRVLTDGEGERRMGRISFALNPGGGVYIPHHRQAGDTLRTTIRYHGQVRDGLIIRVDSAGRRTIFADNWPDRLHRWLPVPDHPSDKVTVDFHIETSPGYTVIANGVLVKVDTLLYGRTVWHFTMREPIPPYGIVVGAGPLVTTTLAQATCRVRCVPLALLTFREDSSWAGTGPFRRAGDMVDYFSGLIGPFPYRRLTHVESTTIFGGMENPTAIFYDAKAFARHSLSELTVAHETAHQWFGDAITERDWHHLWLSEGFADYFAALWLRHADGDSAFRAEMQKEAASVFGSQATARPILDTTATDLMGMLNSNNYSKGSWVLHSLRGLMGDSAFVKGIRDWYASRRDSTALSSDFGQTMSAAAGQDLTWYFLQALTQPGFPRLEVTWRAYGKRLTLTLRQTQPEEWGLFRIPNLRVTVDGRTVPVDVEGRETVLNLRVAKAKIHTVVVDPDGWWLLQTMGNGEQGTGNGGR